MQEASRRAGGRSSWTLVQLRNANARPPPREATGDGEEGGCRLARVHEAGKRQWILWSVLVCTSRLHVSIGPWSNIGEVFRHEPATTRVQMHVCEAFFSFRAHAAGNSSRPITSRSPALATRAFSDPSAVSLVGSKYVTFA